MELDTMYRIYSGVMLLALVLTAAFYYFRCKSLNSAIVGKNDYIQTLRVSRNNFSDERDKWKKAFLKIANKDCVAKFMATNPNPEGNCDNIWR